MAIANNWLNETTDVVTDIKNHHATETLTCAAAMYLFTEIA